MKNEWIPVEKSLPEIGQYVLVVKDRGDYDSAELISQNPIEWDIEGVITHWFPIPAYSQECEKKWHEWRRSGELPKQMLDLNESVLKLKFSQVRSKCLLQNANITTIRELVNFTEDEFLKIGNCGMITFKDIKETMWRYGIRFRDEDDAKNSRSTN